MITKARKNLLELEENFYSLTTFAEDDTSMEGMELLEVFKKKILGPIIYFFDGRSLPIYEKSFFIYVAGVLMEHFLEGIAPLR